MEKDNNKILALIQEARSENTSSERLKELAAINDNLAQIVASNVAAPSYLLKELASHPSKVVRKAVTGNPNTTKETLLKLGEFFPQELLNNPVFDLLILDELNFIEKIPVNTLSVLLEQSEVPKFLSKYASNHQSELIRELSQMQVSISGEMQEGWHELAKKEIK